MNRAIVGLHQDDQAHWVADLDCGHTVHMRHQPPFTVRAWVLTEEGRASRVGTELECVRCRRLEIPDGFEVYRRTAAFDEGSIPRGLLSRHTVKSGSWGRIHVEAGALRYRLHAPLDQEHTLEAGGAAGVPPGVEHEVAPIGPVRFFVEFLRRREP